MKVEPVDERVVQNHASVMLVGVGDLGARIGYELLAAGRRVVGVRRNADRIPVEFEAHSADVGDPASLATLPNVATLIYVMTAGERTADAYQRAYVDGLRNVLAAVRPSRVLSVSSTAVYEVDDGGWVDEMSPTAPTGFSGRAMLEMEHVAEDSPIESCAVRLGGVYGPGRTRFVEQVRSGKATFGPEPAYTNRIHADDAATLIASLAVAPKVEPIVIGVDNDPAERREVITWMADRLDVSVPPVDLSAAPNSNKRCSNRLALSLGFAPRYPSFREGYASILDLLG